MERQDASTSWEEPLPRLDPSGRDPAAALLDLCSRRGIRARVVSVARADALREELSARRARGELDEQLFEECLASLSFAPPEDFPSARSIVVAALPRPETAAVFEVNGVPRRLPIPPTYTGYYTIADRWVRWLGAVLATAGHRAAATNLPLKPLAAWSGLASYGRNNIAYVAGLGSYFELVAAYTDLPCERDGWAPPSLLERCLRCRACVSRCPTGAIPDDRVLLRAERCLVFHNERPGEVAFPEWIEPAAHHAVIGCMECQWTCPENRGRAIRAEEAEAFSADETAILLAGAEARDLPEETASKLARLDVLRFLPLLRRNLRAAFAAEPRQGPRPPRAGGAAAAVAREPAER